MAFPQFPRVWKLGALLKRGWCGACSFARHPSSQHARCWPLLAQGSQLLSDCDARVPSFLRFFAI
jgi:hypothetical protein